jgi:hypothetical protein
VLVFRLGYAPIWDLHIQEVLVSKITWISMECGICRFDTRHVVILKSRIPEQR